MKNKLFIITTLLAIAILIATELLFPDNLILTVLIVSFAHGSLNVMYYGNTRYSRRIKPLDYPGWGVPHDSQTPVQL